MQPPLDGKMLTEALRLIRLFHGLNKTQTAGHAADPNAIEKTRNFVAGKTLKMLDWVATIAGERNEQPS
jgi:hypothetical protein